VFTAGVRLSPFEDQYRLSFFSSSIFAASGRSGEYSLFINIPRHSYQVRLAFLIAGRHVRFGDNECAWGKCRPRPRRLLDYALAVTTAVKNATVMISINIVTALIACVVISSPYCLAFVSPVEAGRLLGSPG